MARQEQKWVAEDGTPFDTKQEAEDHDVSLIEARNVEDYIKMVGADKARATLLKKHLTQFTDYVKRDVKPPADPKKPRKAKDSAA